MFSSSEPELVCGELGCVVTSSEEGESPNETAQNATFGRRPSTEETSVDKKHQSEVRATCASLSAVQGKTQVGDERQQIVTMNNSPSAMRSTENSRKKTARHHRHAEILSGRFSLLALCMSRRSDCRTVFTCSCKACVTGFTRGFHLFPASCPRSPIQDAFRGFTWKT